MSMQIETYARLLERFVMANAQSDAEQNLADAFELGRKFVEQSVPPDELVLIHHHALVTLAQTYPDLALADVAEKISAPLLEMSMAYGLAFRQQTEKNLHNMVQEHDAHTSRLQAVGTLAAGIAHDFNNIVGSILGYAELLHDDYQEHAGTRRKLEQIMKACGRARDLVNRMLTFARNQPDEQQRGEPLPLDLSAQVREAIELLSPFLKTGVVLSLREEVSPAIALAPEGVIQQLIMNLCLNANDAIESRGEIRVEILAERPSPALLPHQENLLCLKVVDTGTGMPPETIEQVFNPFFTTKEPGHGSGLGLSVVHGVVTQLGGMIEVFSECVGPNRGTVFRLFIPLLHPVQTLENIRMTHYGKSTAD